MELNYKLLEETQKEIQEMFFWKEKIEINTEEYDVIHDYDQACENAFDVFFDYEDKEGLSWGDILEENMAKLWKTVFEAENFSDLIKIINGVPIPEISVDCKNEDSDMLDEMEYEIMLCTKSRFICGRENIFFEKLFKVYKLGGWPCGWNNGKIIVYVPKNS